MKFLRTFMCNTEDEVTAVRKHIPDAPVFASCLLHGSDASPQRLDLFRSDRPHESSEQPFCVYERNAEGQLSTDYVASTEQPTAVKGKGKAKRKPKSDTATWIAEAMGAPK